MTADRAVLRYARFTSIEERYNIACELRDQPEIEGNSAWVAKVREEWKQKQSKGAAT